MSFLDEFVREKPTGFSQDQPPFQYFVMGANRWRQTDTWPPQPIEYRKLFLTGNGAANSSKGNGALIWEKPTVKDATDSYVYNPDDPVPTQGGSLLWPTAGPRDQTIVEERQDVLVYSSPILSETVEIAGPVILQLYATTTAKDTDFTAKLVDVHLSPDGKETPYGITDGILRARFRESDTTTKLVEPGKIYDYPIDLGNTSIAFLPGHRIRLEVSSSNFPKFDRNLNTGGAFGEEAAGVLATQTIYRSDEYASHFVLPVIPN
jgi:putative CocE/NonD family hydrolase